MTDRLAATPGRPRLSTVAVAFATALAVLAAGVVLLALRTSDSSNGSSRQTSAATVRYAAISAVLQARSAAVLAHDRRAFLATVDPRSPRFRRVQARMFANLAAVDFAGWSYSMTPMGRRPPPDAGHYRVPVWAPSDFTVNYRLAHFDRQPTNLRQYPTFIRRAGRWYLASLTDYASRGLVSATDLWDYARVDVVRRSDVLVLGSSAQRATMLAVADDIQTAIPQVTSVWGERWSRRAVVLVPNTAHEMALINADHEDLSQIAALASAEVQTEAGHPSPVGRRITINPENWPKLSALGAQVVLRHELTHVATESVTGTQMPTWLIEGFADYVGFKFADVPVATGASELQAAVREGNLPSRLPPDRGFRGDNAQLAVHYESAWLACRTIAQRFGESKLVRFYRAVGTSTRSSATALRAAFTSVLHLSQVRFVALWRATMQAELA